MDESRPLHEQINKATRKLHTELNRLVVFYLPLAVPLSATSPQAYASGIGAFAQVYYAFEKLWVEQLQLDGRHHPSDLQDTWMTPGRDGEASTQHGGDRIRDVLRQLCVPSLMRTRALKDDLAYLDHEGMNGNMHGSGPTLPNLQAFVSHIRISIAEKPHLVLAYAWIFYMALFSGGRWIRSQLYAAGEDFWAQSQQKSEGVFREEKLSEETQEQPTAQYRGLSFFHFPGNEDGEDIKRDFKARFAEVDHTLTGDERREIVAESGRIFEFSIAMVQELDSLSQRQHGTPRLSLGTYQPAKSSGASVQEPISSSLGNLVSIGRTSRTWPTIQTISYLILLVFGYLVLRVSIASLLSKAT